MLRRNPDALRTQSIASMRARARAPRAALLVMCAVLAAVGLKELAVPTRPVAAPGAPAAARDITAEAFAESFVRSYLTWDARKPDAHERAVAAFLAADADAHAGLSVPPTSSQTVEWTAVVADRSAGARQRIVTVSADTSAGPVHLGVPVARDAGGLLFVARPPAVVGAPGSTTKGVAPAEQEVEDRALRLVAGRVVRNYLAGERDDLAADLDARAVLSLPDLRLRVRTTDAVTWVSKPNRAAVVVTAAGRDGLQLTLRYELDVVRRAGRWVVRTVHTNPVAREGD